jgi:hypothetical protein
MSMASRTGPRLAIATLGLVFSLSGCGSAPTPIASSSPKLPTVPSADVACAGIGLEHTTLAGDRSDPRLAWLVQPGGKRLDVVWPPGFSARFVPTLEILDASGNVVFRAGDPVDGGCTGDPYLLIEPGG